jgi:hypothetical protein
MAAGRQEPQLAEAPLTLERTSRMAAPDRSWAGDRGREGRRG